MASARDLEIIQEYINKLQKIPFFPSEAEALTAIKDLINEHDIKAFRYFISTTKISSVLKLEYDNSEFKCTSGLTCLLIIKKYYACLTYLKEKNIFSNLLTSTSNFLDQSDDLMFACYLNDEKAVRLLVSQPVDLLRVNKLGNNALSMTNSASIAAAIFDKAVASNCAIKLLSLKTENDKLLIEQFDPAVRAEVGDKAYQLFLDKLYSGEKKAAEDLLELLPFLFSAETLKHLLNLSTFRSNEDEDENTVTYTVLAHAVHKNYKKIVKKLIALGAKIDEGRTCKDDPKKDKASPLMIASKFEHSEVAQVLIEQGANLLHCDAFNHTVLSDVKTLEMYSIISQKAQEQGCWTELLSIENNDKDSIYMQYLIENKLDLLLELLKTTDYKKLIDVEDLLDSLITLYFKPSKHIPDLEEIITLIKKENSFDHSNKTEVELDPITVYSTFFGNTYPTETPTTKRIALQKAITQYNVLLNNKQKCFSYLEFLDKEFLRYFHETHHQEFPTVDKKSFEFKKISDLFFPIPTEQYVGLKKHHALQAFLITLLQSHGLAQEFYRWIGFIPKEIADPMMASGAYIIEDHMSSGTILFHNIFAHMIQLALLIYMLENGEIDREFTSCGVKYYLSIKDILHALISMKKFETTKSLWGSTNDSYNFTNVSFSTPHQLGSFIMQSETLKGLSNSLIDSFCKGFKKLLRAYQTQPALKKMNSADFVDKMNDKKLNLFFSPSYLTEQSIFKQLNKGKKLREQGKRYAIFDEDYELNRKFTPKQFGVNDLA